MGFNFQHPVSKHVKLVGSVTQSTMFNKTCCFNKKRTDVSSIIKFNSGIEFSIAREGEEFFVTSVKYENQNWINEFVGFARQKYDLGLQGVSCELCMHF